MRPMRIFSLLLFAAIAGVSGASAQVAVSITVAPPVLPVYVQPPIPGPGYIWTPGYWAYGDDGYYWVPGTWVLPPAVDLLWTPGYWGWGDGIYLWHAGYWGPHIGFYGGINYGFGYTGVGYAGGFWRGGVFAYNRTVNNFGSVNITNTYNKTIINNNVTNVTNVSFNGGAGGTTAKATQQELATANDSHTPMTQQQQQHQTQASNNPGQYAKNNKGQPTIGGTSHAAQFNGQGVVGTKTATSSTGNNATAGGTANKGTAAGGANTLSTKQGTGTAGSGTGQKVTNSSAGGAAQVGAAYSGHPSMGYPGAGPGGGGPARLTGGGGPGGSSKSANIAAPNRANFSQSKVARVGGGGPGGGQHPGKGPPPHHH